MFDYLKVKLNTVSFPIGNIIIDEDHIVHTDTFIAFDSFRTEC